jgi:hypothetical protein
MKPETVLALLGPASARGITVHDLAHQLLDTIAADKMTDAVLDDTEEVARVAEMKRGRAA